MDEGMDFFRQWLRGKGSYCSQEQADHVLNSVISSALSVNLQQLSILFSGIPELITRTFSLKTGQKAAVIYMDGLVDKASIEIISYCDVPLF
jgi:spore germination protein